RHLQLCKHDVTESPKHRRVGVRKLLEPLSNIPYNACKSLLIRATRVIPENSRDIIEQELVRILRALEGIPNVNGIRRQAHRSFGPFWHLVIDRNEPTRHIDRF